MKIKITLLLVSVVSLLQITTAQVGINTTTPDSSAELDIESETKGLLIPRMTSVLRLAITNPADGLLVFDTDLKNFFFWNAAESAWFSLNPWTYQGPDGISTYDISTILNSNVGIGTNVPQEKLHVAGNTRVDGNLDVRQNINTVGNIRASSISGNGANVSNVNAIQLDGHNTSYFGTSADIQAIQANKADKTELYTGQNSVTVRLPGYSSASRILNQEIFYTRIGDLIFLKGTVRFDWNIRSTGINIIFNNPNPPDFPGYINNVGFSATGVSLKYYANPSYIPFSGTATYYNHQDINQIAINIFDNRYFDSGLWTVNFQFLYYSPIQ